MADTDYLGYDPTDPDPLQTQRIMAGMVPPPPAMGAAAALPSPAPTGNSPDDPADVAPVAPPGTAQAPTTQAPPVDPLKAQKDRYAQAQATLNQVQSERPAPPKPKWWQMLGAVGAGALVGAENAGGHSRTLMDPKAVANGILRPGYDQKMQDYNQRLQVAQGDVAEAEKGLQVGALTQEEQSRAHYYDDQTQARRDDAKTRAEAGVLERQITAQAQLLKERRGWTQPATDPVPPGHSVMPDLSTVDTRTGQSKFVQVLPPAQVPLPPELAQYYPGSKPGDMISYADMADLRDELKKIAIEKARGITKQATTPSEVLMAPAGTYTPDQIAEARKEFNQEHRDPNALPTGNFVQRNPMLPADARDEGVLQGVDPHTQAIIKQLVDYKYALPTGIALRTPEWQNIIGLAAQYDPSFDASQYSQRQRLQSDFKSGRAATNIRNLNTVTQHLDQLEEDWQKLNNTNFLPGVMNPLENTVGKTVSADIQNRYNNVRRDQQAVASEMMRLWREVGANSEEVEKWASTMSPDLSPEAQKGAIQGAYRLIAGRLSALRGQYETGMGRPADFHIMTPETASRYKAHGIDVRDLAPNATYGSSAPSQTSGGRPPLSDLIPVQ